MPAGDRAPQPERVLLKQGLGAPLRQGEGVREGSVQVPEFEPLLERGEVAARDRQALGEERFVRSSGCQDLDGAGVDGERLGALIDLCALLDDGDGDPA
jgi:hypothetical protein